MTTSLAQGNSHFEQIVDLLYQAPTEPHIWPRVLQDIAHWVDSASAGLITRRNDNWVGWSLSTDMPASANVYLASEAASRSQSTLRLFAANHAGFLTDRDLFAEAEYHADPFMTEWGERENIEHAAATAILVPTGDALVCQVQRRKGQPLFEPREIDRLDALRPHLARAGLLSSRWRLERLRVAVEALAMLEFPAAALDSSGSVVSANLLMQQLASHIVWRSKDRIALADQRANALLAEAIKNLSCPSDPSVRSIASRAGRNGDRAVVHLIPATGRSREFFGGGFGILIITPISSPKPLDPSLIQGLFDLSPAEARVASGIAQGLTVEDIAAKGDVAYQTVRSHVKRVLAKTGTKRQAEAAVLLSGVSKLNN